MKTLLLQLTMVTITMLSCSSPDCTNGIQDGTETGIDCGGDCPPCPTTTTTLVSPTEQDLEGIWVFHQTILYSQSSGTYDTTLHVSPTCLMELTLDTAGVGTNQYIAYGSVGLCNYSSQTGWWVGKTSKLFNDMYEIVLLTSDSLKLRYYQGSNWSQYDYYQQP